MDLENTVRLEFSGFHNPHNPGKKPCQVLEDPAREEEVKRIYLGRMTESIT